MDSTDFKSSAIFLTLCILTPIVCYASSNSGAPDPAPPQYSCNFDSNYTKGSQTEKNVYKVLDALLNASSHPAAYNTTVAGTGEKSSGETIYGLLQCFAGTTVYQCNECAQLIVQSTIATCQKTIGAIAWYPQCFLRFESFNFIGQLDENHYWHMNNRDDVEDAAVFDQTAHQFINSLIIKALQPPSPNKFAFGTNATNISGIPTIYGFVQCWRDISVENCRKCLQFALTVMQYYVSGKQGAIAVTRSCFTRYEIYPFFNSVARPQSPSPQAQPAPPKAVNSKSEKQGSGSSKLPAILGATGGFLLVLLLLGSGFLAYRRRTGTHVNETGATDATQDNLESGDQMMTFSLETLKGATNNFDENFKVGGGGFGVVYKATLPSGRIVAAKKLLYSTRGKQDFTNEINLLFRIQHRNLINLLGCCAEGSHRILVYEFLSNGSLDKFLFDQEKVNFLTWEKRYNIILGTAKGLRYLHEESKVKIIHRDIKVSNILLDENFNAKLADFGLARLFEEDQSHVQTTVAGTYGYMAPEYAMQGQLSSRADVYSFGVLLIEIMSGRRNTDTDADVSSLLGWAWNLYQEGNIPVMVDDIIKTTGNMEQVIRCIHVALLCTQADSFLRPSMSMVVLMLSSAAVTLQNPTMPAFVVSNQKAGADPEPTPGIPTISHPSSDMQEFTNASVSVFDLQPR